jgi:hypothetical protein
MFHRAETGPSVPIWESPYRNKFNHFEVIIMAWYWALLVQFLVFGIAIPSVLGFVDGLGGWRNAIRLLFGKREPKEV